MSDVPSLPVSAPAAIGDAVAMALLCLSQVNAQLADPANQVQLAETEELSYMAKLVHLRNIQKTNPSPQNLYNLQAWEGQ